MVGVNIHYTSGWYQGLICAKAVSDSGCVGSNVAKNTDSLSAMLRIHHVAQLASQTLMIVEPQIWLLQIIQFHFKSLSEM